MPTAVITGASAGLGPSAGHRPGRARLEPGPRRPACPTGCSGWPTSSAVPTRLHAVPGDVGDPEHRRRLAEAAAGFGAAGPAGQQRQHAGPQPAAAAGRTRPPTNWRPSCDTNVVAPLALIQLTLPALAATGGTRASTSPPTPRSALPGLGRLRQRQGGAGPPERDAGRREHPRAALVQLRPGRHAHRDAPGGLPRRGHQRPAGTGVRAAGAAAADRRTPAQRPLHQHRAGAAASVARTGGGPMTLHAQAHAAPSTRFDLPADLTATEPPEHRGLSRDGVRLLVAEAVRHRALGTAIRLVHSRFRELGRHLRPGDLVVVNTSQTVAAEVDGVPARPAGRWCCTWRSDRPAARRQLGARTAHRPGRRPAAAGRRARRGGPAGRRLAVRLLAPYPEHAGRRPARAARLWRAEVTGNRPAAGLPAGPARPADQLRLPARAVAAGRLPDGVRPASGQCRDAQCRPAVQRRAGDRPGQPRNRVRTDHPAHRGVLAGGRRGAAGRTLRGAGRHRAAGRTPPGWPAAG